MGTTFIERIQNTQITIINQIQAVLINTFSNQINEQFALFLYKNLLFRNSRPQNLMLKKGLTQQ